MSEYMEKFNVSRLVGSPPGYVGYEEGGQLTEKVRRRPYCVVLFDEIEKAHPDVWNIMLQILEDGHVTDSLGRKVDFRNTIIIMTSNVGAELVKKSNVMGFGTADPDTADYEAIKEKLLAEAKKVFKPEFLNRLTDIIVFHSLTRENLTKIVELEVKKVGDRLKERKIVLQVAKPAMEFLIEKGYDPQYGARPLKRAIERYVEDPLAEEIIRGAIKDGDTVAIDLKDGALTFTPTGTPSPSTPAGSK
jgi:ATP-dependent Clp protease ATP-binding subunit ClpC